MHGIIYQISDSPIDRDNYIGVDTVSEGDMVGFDYLYDTTEEERRKQIQYLVEHTLPKGMFTIGTDGETLVYQGGFAEWRKTYLDASYQRGKHHGMDRSRLSVAEGYCQSSR